MVTYQDFDHRRKVYYYACAQSVKVKATPSTFQLASNTIVLKRGSLAFDPLQYTDSNRRNQYSFFTVTWLCGRNGISKDKFDTVLIQSFKRICTNSAAMSGCTDNRRHINWLARLLSPVQAVK